MREGWREREKKKRLENAWKKKDNSAEAGEGHSGRRTAEAAKPEPRMKWASTRSRQDCQMLPHRETEATQTTKGPLESFNMNWKTSKRERMETWMAQEWGAVSGDA